jgi:hypothetical protein
MPPLEHRFLFWPRSRTAKLSWEPWWLRRGDGAPTDKPTPDGFKALFVTANPPGFAAATMNFRIEDAGPMACTLTTETRVYATDASTRRRFARYWRVIYPGSALIRRSG